MTIDETIVGDYKRYLPKISSGREPDSDFIASIMDVGVIDEAG